MRKATKSCEEGNLLDIHLKTFDFSKSCASWGRRVYFPEFLPQVLILDLPIWHICLRSHFLKKLKLYLVKAETPAGVTGKAGFCLLNSGMWFPAWPDLSFVHCFSCPLLFSDLPGMWMFSCERPWHGLPARSWAAFPRNNCLLTVISSVTSTWWGALSLSLGYKVHFSLRALFCIGLY